MEREPIKNKNFNLKQSMYMNINEYDISKTGCAKYSTLI